MDKPYLLLLPGWSMDRSIWGRFSEELSKRYRVDYMDWSDMDSRDSFREELERYILKIESRDVIILGWSLGAVVATEFAMDNPESLHKLILISPTARFTQDRASCYRSGWSSKVLDRMIALLDSEDIETVKAFRKNLFSDGEVQSGQMESILETLEKQEIQSWDRLKQGLLYLKEMDLRDGLHGIEVPTLMIHGAEDGITPVEAAKDMAERNGSYFDLKTIPGCGHIPFLTEMECCLEAIREFIEGRRSHDR